MRFRSPAQWTRQKGVAQMSLLPYCRRPFVDPQYRDRGHRPSRRRHRVDPPRRRSRGKRHGHFGRPGVPTVDGGPSVGWGPGHGGASDGYWYAQRQVSTPSQGASPSIQPRSCHVCLNGDRLYRSSGGHRGRAWGGDGGRGRVRRHLPRSGQERVTARERRGVLECPDAAGRHPPGPPTRRGDDRAVDLGRDHSRGKQAPAHSWRPATAAL